MTPTASETRDVLLLTALTNLHAGSGNAEYGVIDNLVQRDTISRLPVINASSLKGAFREFFKGKLTLGDDKIAAIFGHDYDDSEGGQTSFHMGNHAFFEAQLLCLPIRSNQKPFFRATCPFVLQTFIQRLKDFNHSKAADIEKALKDLMSIATVKGTPSVFQTFEGSLWLEDWEAQFYVGKEGENKAIEKTKATNILGSDLALLHDDDFKTLCNNENLPIIARNHLENGVSKNLWYEQIVPRESRFFSMTLRPTANTDFSSKFAKDNKNIVQIGANASVGYGYSKIQILEI